MDHQTTRTTALRLDVKGLQARVPGLVILCHPDPSRLGDEAPLPELVSGQTVRLSRLEPSFAAPGRTGAIRPLGLAHLSRQPVRLIPGAEAGGVRIDASTTRTRVTLGGVPLRGYRELSAAEVERGVPLVLSERVALLLHRLDPVPATPPDFGLVGESPALVRLRQQIVSAAELEVPILLRGETGTGKELVARALHEASHRREGPFVAVNMGALSPHLAASELFGAVRGAYTGADRAKQGFFESADGGTLFLDEIGAVPPEIQVMLLRVLESHRIQPVGSVESRPVDVRVLAATDVDLDAATKDGRFQASLLHRLAGFDLRLPPLRERGGDVARLLYHFLDRELRAIGRSGLETGDDRPWPPAEVVARLVAHGWPGNVRELRNVARRLAVVRETGTARDLVCTVEALLDAADTLGSSSSSSSSSTRSFSPLSPRPSQGAEGRGSRRYRKPKDVADDELVATLATHGWRIQPTARALRVSRASLYRLIDACPRIRKAADLTAQEVQSALAQHEGDPQAAAAHLEVSPQGLKRRLRELKG